MGKYLLIDSRGEYEAADSRAFFELGAELKRRGDTVEIYLVQNGALAARAGARADALATAVHSGIACLVEPFALQERAIDSLAEWARPAPLSTIIDRMADGWNVMWH